MKIYQLQWLELVIDRFLMKLFRTSHIHVVVQCQKQFGFDSCSGQLDGHRRNLGKNQTSLWLTAVKLRLFFCFDFYIFIFIRKISSKTKNKNAKSNKRINKHIAIKAYATRLNWLAAFLRLSFYFPWTEDLSYIARKVTEIRSFIRHVSQDTLQVKQVSTVVWIVSSSKLDDAVTATMSMPADVNSQVATDAPPVRGPLGILTPRHRGRAVDSRHRPAESSVDGVGVLYRRAKPIKRNDSSVNR